MSFVALRKRGWIGLRLRLRLRSLAVFRLSAGFRWAPEPVIRHPPWHVHRPPGCRVPLLDVLADVAVVGLALVAFGGVGWSEGSGGG